eukprot:gene30012-39198_t
MLSPSIDPSQLLVVDDSRFQEHGIGDDYNILDPIFGYSETSSSSDIKKKKKVRLSTLCGFDDCKTQASFRNPDGKDQIYCAKHKLPGMIDFRSRKCENSNCSTNASFNYPGLKKRRFCKQHAERGMIYLRRSTPSAASAFQSAEELVLQQSRINGGSSPPQSSLDDLARGHHIMRGCERKKQVDRRKCEHDGCSKVASFNVVGNKRRRFCKQHSEPGMQYVGRKMCGRASSNENTNTQLHISKPSNEYMAADEVFSHNLVGYAPQQQKPEDFSDEDLYSNMLDGSENSLRRSNIASLLSDNEINKSCDSLIFSAGMPSLPLGTDLMQSNILSLSMDMNSHSHSINHMNLFNMNNMNFHPNMNNHMNFAIEIGHPDSSYLIMNDFIMIQSGSVDGKAVQEAAVSSNFDFEGFHNFPREKC